MAIVKSLKKHPCPSSKMFSPNLNWKRIVYHLKVTNDKSFWFHTKILKIPNCLLWRYFSKKKKLNTKMMGSILDLLNMEILFDVLWWSISTYWYFCQTLYFPMCYNDFQKDIWICFYFSFPHPTFTFYKTYYQFMLKINTKYANITI